VELARQLLFARLVGSKRADFDWFAAAVMLFSDDLLA